MLLVVSRPNPRRTCARRVAVASVFALIGGLVSLTVSPAQADVSADSPDCNYSADHVTNADLLLQGIYRIAPWDPVKLPLNLTWTENPYKDDSWQNTQHNLRWTLDLLQAALSRPADERYAGRLYGILRDWEADNPRPGAKSKWAWSDHSTARRAIVLACVNDLLPPTTDTNKALLQRMLKKHGSTLAEDGFYVKYGNHALDQSIGLVEMGRVLGYQPFIDKAGYRINEFIGRSLDVQGVMNEQSVYYQYYNYTRYLAARARLEDAGAEVGPNFARVARMPNFLAHATLPTGRYEMIGDTNDSAAPVIPDTIAEYAATGGGSGPKPARTVAKYSAGFLFARSGWGREDVRAATDETFFSTKWGAAPVLHGHADGMSLTLASWGSRLLIDSGLYRYGSDPFRLYVKGRSAHNVVTVDGSTWSNTAATGRVVDNTLTSDKYVDIQLRGAGYPGVTHTRRITYSRALDYLVVDDRLSSTATHKYRQVWHLGSDADPVVIGSKNVRTRRAKGNVLIAQLYGRPTTRIVKGATSPIQGWTSYSYGKMSKTPAAEVIQTGRSVRYITLLVPGSGQPRPNLRSFKTIPGGYMIRLTNNGKTEQLSVSGSTVKVYALS